MSRWAAIGVCPVYGDKLWDSKQANDLWTSNFCQCTPAKTQMTDCDQMSYNRRTPSVRRQNWKIDISLLWRFDKFKMCSYIARTPSVRRMYDEMCVVFWVNSLGMGVRCTPRKIYIFVQTHSVQRAYGSLGASWSLCEKWWLRIDRCTPHKTKVGQEK